MLYPLSLGAASPAPELALDPSAPLPPQLPRWLLKQLEHAPLQADVASKRARRNVSWAGMVRPHPTGARTMKTLTPEKIRWMEQFMSLKPQPAPEAASKGTEAAAPAPAKGKGAPRPAPAVGHKSELMAA